MPLFKRKKIEDNPASRQHVVADSHVVSLADLEHRAKRASQRFWCLFLSFVLVMTMCVPYLSLAATVAGSDSDVFTGEVVPGYSMGGVKVAAYGIDVNSWGMVKKPTAVKSTYGVWSGARGDALRSNMKISGDGTLGAEDKALGWETATGRVNYSRSNPDGVSSSNQSNRYTEVAPYRTASDAQYWDGKTPSSTSGASADITVSLFADFVAIGVVNGKASLLRSPDSINVKSAKMYEKGKPSDKSSAVPYYVPLSAIFDEFGIKEGNGNTSISQLMDRMARDSSAATKLANVAQSSNLLSGTSYSSVNNGNSKSDAFNPYPYTMVFSCSDGISKVVSSLYSNSEAYVYFSPASAYATYLDLKEEYNYIINNSPDIDGNAQAVFRCGYYLAEMSILEAYLEEVLPQDMTRGYVGPSEAAAAHTGQAGSGGSPFASKNMTKASTFKLVPYSTIMYDVAISASAKKVNGAEYNLGGTNAMMNLLSVFGYDSGEKPGVGVMKGASRDYVFGRMTPFTPYEMSDAVKNKTNASSGVASVGMYCPPYNPIQAHKMPASERAYRFPIVSSVSYDTLAACISSSDGGLAGNITFSYSSEAMESLNSSELSDYISSGTGRNQVLASALEELDSANSGGTLKAATDVLNKRSIALGVKKGASGFTEEELRGENGTSEAVQTAARIDSALLGYQASSMTADNIHDFIDIIRSTKALKYESWGRFYNPNKSDGQDLDVFLGRVSPAMTNFIPSIMASGYTPAGGDSLNKGMTPLNCSFDYYSIPSLSACLASHSSSDCYYGSLNYEMRPFYTQPFQATLSDSINVSQIEQYEIAKAGLVNLRSRISSAWNDVATLYVMAKRLAYIETIYDMKGSNAYEAKVIFNESQTQPYISKAAENGMVYTDPDQFKDQSQLQMSADQEDDIVMKPLTPKKSNVAWYDEVAPQARAAKPADGYTTVTETLPKQYATSSDDADSGSSSSTKKKQTKSDDQIMKDQTQWLKDNAGKTASELDTKRISVYNSSIRFLSEDTWNKMSAATKQKYGLQDKDTAVTEVTDVPFSTLFTYKYNLRIISYLDAGGEFYWVPTSTIVKKVRTGGYVTTLTQDQGLFRYPMEAFIHGVAFDTSIPALKGQTFNSTQAIGSVYRALIYSANRNVTDTVKQILGNRKTASKMPEQMTNVVGWATDQESAVSDASYLTETDIASNLIVNTGEGDSIADNIEDGTITNIVDLHRYRCTFDEDTGKILPDEALNESMAIQAKMVRGVEGTTTLATLQPSCYSISATVQRRSMLSDVVGVSYPYAGICNGRLADGTNRYAELEAHTIDYTSLENGVSGDLANTSSSRIVSLANSEYASINGFSDNLGKVGAYLGEMGSSMLSSTSDLFGESFFRADRQLSLDATNKANAAPTRMVSASDWKFDSTVHHLVSNDAKGTALPNTDSSNPQAAASVSVIGNWAQDTLLNRGYALYAMLQEISLLLVVVSLLVIAFRNFFAYSARSARQANIITAQTQLKTVLPRAVIAVFMIGIPPMGGSIGFQGGAFLLCQFLGGIIGYIASVFTDLDGTAIMGMWDFGQSAMGSNIFSFGAFNVISLIIGAMFLLGTVCVLIQSLLLIAFYLSAPLVWALYVWPYAASGKNGEPSIFASVTMKLGVGNAGKVGNIAPSGWLAGYLGTAVLSVGWALLFWVASMLFAGTSAYSSGTVQASTLSNTGYSTASAALIDATAFGSGTISAVFAAVFLTVVAVIVFVLMVNMMKFALHRGGGTTVNLAQEMAASITRGFKETTAVPAAAVAGATPDAIEAEREVREQRRQTVIEDRIRETAQRTREVSQRVSTVERQPIAAAVASQHAARTTVRKPVGDAQVASAPAAAVVQPVSAAVNVVSPSAMTIDEAVTKMLDERGVDASKLSAKALGDAGYALAALKGAEEAEELAAALKLADYAGRASLLAEASAETIKALKEAGVLLADGSTVDVAALADGSAEKALAAAKQRSERKLAEAISEEREQLVKNLAESSLKEAAAMAAAANRPLGTTGKALSQQAIGKLGKLDISSPLALSEAAGDIARGFMDEYKMLGFSDAGAIEQAEKEISKALGEAATPKELAAADQAAKAKAKGLPSASTPGGKALAPAAALVAAHSANMLRSMNIPFASSEQSVPMNILKAYKAISSFDQQDKTQIGWLAQAKPGINLREMAVSASLLEGAATMVSIMISARNPQMVALFTEKLVNDYIPEHLTENENVSAALEEFKQADSINAIISMVGNENAYLAKRPGLEKFDVKDIKLAVRSLYASEDLLKDPDTRRIMVEPWSQSGVNTEDVFSGIERAMTFAHVMLPAYIIDAQTPAYNGAAVELDDNSIVISDFSYAVLKGLAAPISIKEAFEQATTMVSSRYQDFDNECRTAGIAGGAEEFEFNRRKIADIEAALKKANANFSEEEISKILRQRAERPQSEFDIETETRQIIEGRELVRMLSRQCNVDAWTYNEHPEYLREELVRACSMGCSRLYDDGSATRPRKDLASQQPSKTLEAAPKANVIGAQPQQAKTLQQAKPATQGEAPKPVSSAPQLKPLSQGPQNPEPAT